jgi:AcrR family transcriptional regulator/DNA-binding transcriptional regulator YdaS (Cro superfamily)
MAEPQIESETTTGARVRAVRLAKGRTLRAIAASVGVSPATLSQIENGRVKLSGARLGEIAEALGVAESEILESAAAMPPAPWKASRRGHGTSWSDWRSYDPLTLDPVLHAAIDEMVEVGYHAASIRTIADRCGMSVSAVYTHYDSKQHILMAIHELCMSETLERARAARDQGTGPVERFALLIEHLALVHTNRRELAFIGATEMLSLGPENLHTITRLRTEVQRMVDCEVDAAVEAGRFRVDHPRDASRAVITMCTAIPTWWHPGGTLSPTQVAERYVDFALNLMRARH